MMNLLQSWDLKIDPSVLKTFSKIPKKYALTLRGNKFLTFWSFLSILNLNDLFGS